MTESDPYKYAIIELLKTDRLKLLSNTYYTDIHHKKKKKKIVIWNNYQYLKKFEL